MCSGLSRKELVSTIGENLQWFTASGQPKRDACVKVLQKLETMGEIESFPGVRPCRGGKSPSISLPEPGPELVGSLSDVGAVTLEQVKGVEQGRLWNAYVEGYHYLGYKKPFGFAMRYFIESSRGKLGCILLAGAAKSLGVRDGWIGWSDQQRLQNLAWVINNTRFVLFPWVRVKHLASHVLGKMARQVSDDWEVRFRYRPLLMETFIDPERYRGVSYQAAGWRLLGKTTGQGLSRPGHTYRTSPKLLFVRPLVRDFRARLCSDQLMKDVAQ